MLATDRQKLSIQMKIMMSNDCEVQSMLKGLNFTELYLVRANAMIQKRSHHIEIISLSIFYMYNV